MTVHPLTEALWAAAVPAPVGIPRCCGFLIIASWRPRCEVVQLSTRWRPVSARTILQMRYNNAALVKPCAKKPTSRILVGSVIRLMHKTARVYRLTPNKWLSPVHWHASMPPQCLPASSSHHLTPMPAKERAGSSQEKCSFLPATYIILDMESHGNCP